MVGGRRFIVRGPGLVALALALSVLPIAGCGSDSSTTSSTPTDSALPANEQPLSPAEAKEARGKATLREVGGSEATGVATFAPGGLGDTRSVRIQATGLEPTGAKTYAGWLTGATGKLLALATFQVGRDGKLTTEFELAAENIEFVEDGTLDEVLITQGSLERIGPALEEAAEPVAAPGAIGTPVMRGAITGPLTGSAGG